jgi:uncharacterized protein (DUF4415 family)
MVEPNRLNERVRSKFDESNNCKDPWLRFTDTPYDAHSEQDVNRFWENAKVMPPRLRGQRGPQRAPTTQLVSMRLDRLVIDHFKADGPHWQTRVNDTLLEIVKKSASSRRGVKANVQRPIPERNRLKVGRDADSAFGRRRKVKGKPVAKRA